MPLTTEIGHTKLINEEETLFFMSMQD